MAKMNLDEARENFRAVADKILKTFEKDGCSPKFVGIDRRAMYEDLESAIENMCEAWMEER